jgi:hypothetical protein
MESVRIFNESIENIKGLWADREIVDNLSSLIM